MGRGHASRTHQESCGSGIPGIPLNSGSGNRVIWVLSSPANHGTAGFSGSLSVWGQDIQDHVPCLGTGLPRPWQVTCAMT